MTPEFLDIFTQFGPLGLMIGYLVWRERVGAEKRGEVERERADAEKARAAADVELARALTALTVTIQHIDRRLA